MISQETEYNLAQMATEQEEFEEIKLQSPPKSKFSEVKLNLKFLIAPTNKNMEADQNTRTESIYEVDTSKFGKNLP